MQFLIFNIANLISFTILYKVNEIQIQKMKIIHIMNSAYRYNIYYNSNNLEMGLENNKYQLNNIRTQSRKKFPI